MSIKLLTYDVYRSGMTLFKDLADQTYQDKEHLPEYFLRKVAQAEVPAGYDSAYNLIYRVAGDPDEHVNGATIGIKGSQGGGVIQAYVVGSTPLAPNWLSDVPGGPPFVPSDEFLFLILTPGQYYHSFFRFDSTLNTYVKVMDAKDIIFAYIVGNTPFASDWLSLTPNGSALVPQNDKFYVILTAGDYENFIFRYDSTLTTYIMLSGGGGAGGGAIFTYIVGNTPFADDWLSDEQGGDPLEPEEGLLYLVLTPGAHFSAFYRFDATSDVYILVGNARVVELTLAEYLALPAAKQNDGTIYFITDSAETAPNKDDYVPSRVTLPDNPATGTVILWKGAVTGDFDVSPAFYRYDGSHWVRDNLGIEGQTIQVDTMPMASASTVGFVLQYIGATTADYTHNYFYECFNNSGTYSWVNTAVQDGATIQVSTMPAASASEVGKIYQYTGTTTANYQHGFFYECVNVSGSYQWLNAKVQAGDEFQVTTMPVASVALVGKVYQFIGTTTVDYTHNYFYECVNDNGTYGWVSTTVQPGETIQFTTLPTASQAMQGKVYQYIGTTTSDYTHNYFYECVNDNGTYSWENVKVSKSDVVSITQAAFDLLPQSEKDNGQAYFIEDAQLSNSYVAVTGFTPVGTIISVMGITAPNHYLICDGSTYSIGRYPELARYFELQFGSVDFFGGDGVNTFAVPDLRGEFLRGTGTNSHVDANTGVVNGSGAAVGVHQDATWVPSTWVDTANILVAGENAISTDALISKLNRDSSYNINNSKYIGGISYSGTDSRNREYTTRPTNTSVLYCIAAKNIYIDTHGSKDVYGTLEAGQTSVILTDPEITTNSLLDLYTSVYGLNPKTVSVLAGSVTLTFDAQSSDVTVMVSVRDGEMVV